jgi:FkbM family methyltransferase
MRSAIKKAIKHLIGKDLWLRSEVNTPTTFHGSNYGGWSVLKNSLKSDSIVYSFGIGEDASFDLSLIETHSCIVHGFDPTPKSMQWVKQNINNPNFILHPWALGPEDGTLELWLPDNPEHVSASLQQAENRSQKSFQAPCRSLQSIMDKLGHEHVDVLKMDIEGAEYGVIRSIAEKDGFSSVGQLLVEFHHNMKGFQIVQTTETLRCLGSVGFKIAWVSDIGHEVLFVKP